ncbi:MAG: 2-oxo acid dehydrogenase subunit E2 [Clostridia bacterium]|nr:2-oxo acid dehydrogenase subunit E2 [Clostridia bacterium]
MSFKEYIKKASLAPEEGDIIEYLSIRDRLTSNVLVNSQRNIPGTACSREADVTKLWEAFQKLKKECDYPLTFNSLIIKVLVEGLKAAPRLNAHFEYNHRATSGRLIIKKHIDVAMAVCLDSGETFQIKLHHLEDKSLREIALQSEDVKLRIGETRLKSVMFNVARQRMMGLAAKGQLISTFSQFRSAYFGKAKIAKFSNLFKKKSYKNSGNKTRNGLKVDDFTEGTVCYTNWGTLYDKLDVDITYIPPLYPQVFLFGTGRVHDKCCVFEEADGNFRMGKKKVLPMAMIFDHKIGGAADLMPFIKKVDEILENPEIIFEW